jgi:hypothetical protein
MVLLQVSNHSPKMGRLSHHMSNAGSTGEVNPTTNSVTTSKAHTSPTPTAVHFRMVWLR